MQVVRKTVTLVFGMIPGFVALAIGCYPLPVRAADNMAASTRVDASSASKPTAPGDVIEGIVVDEQGKPVAGATVQVYQWGAPVMTKVSNDGAFRIELREPLVSSVELLAASPTGSQQLFTNKHKPGTPAGSPKYVLKPSRAIDVFVVDSSGRPVANAAVDISATWNGCGPLGSSKTDANGQSHMHIPANVDYASIVAHKPGVGFDYFTNERGVQFATEIPPSPIALKFILDGVKPARVQLVYASGKPIAAAALKLRGLTKKGKNGLTLYGTGPAVVTDQQGWASFDFIPASVEGFQFSVRQGQYHFPIDPEFSIGEGGRAQLSFPFDPKFGLEQARNVQLGRVELPEPAHVSGKVAYPDGKPAAGILLQAESIPDERPGPNGYMGYFRGYARTARDGTYRFTLHSNSDYIIAVEDDHWAAVSQLGVFVNEGEHGEHLDFQLEHGTLIHGTVTVGPDKKPCNETNCRYPVATLVQLGPKMPQGWMAEVSPRTREWPDNHRTRLVRWAEFDSQGRYALRVGPGEYTLRLGELSSEAKRIIVADQKEITVDDQILKALPQSVHGKVVEMSGKPVPNAFVTSSPLGVSAMTDKDGRFSFRDRYHGPARVHARSVEANLSGSIALPEEVSMVTIEMDAAANATGKVLDADGRPVVGARVHYVFDSHPLDDVYSLQVDTETDHEGRYAMAGLPIGMQGAKGFVSWYNPATRTYEFLEAPRFTVKPGENRLPNTVPKPSAPKSKG